LCLNVTDSEQYNEAVMLMNTISNQWTSWRFGRHILDERCL